MCNSEKTLEETVKEIEPKLDLVHELMGFGPKREIGRSGQFAKVTQFTITSDGFILGQFEGDVGFNAFMGNPPNHVIERSRNIYKEVIRLDKCRGTNHAHKIFQTFKRLRIEL